MPMLYSAHFSRAPDLSASDGTNTKVLHIFAEKLLFLLRMQPRPTHLCIASDPKGPTFRNTLFPEYKAGRDPTPDEIHEARVFLVDQLLPALGIPVQVHVGWEADDVVGTLSRIACNAGMEVLMYSPDKDLNQLIRTPTESNKGSVVRLKPTSDGAQLYGTLETKNDLGIEPSQMVEYLSLVGDATDNIPGVTGVGPKTAAGWLQEYGTVSNLLEHIDDIKGRGVKTMRSQEGRASYEFSKKLVTISTDMDDSVPRMKAPIDSYRLKVPADGGEAAIQLLAEREMKQTIQGLQDVWRQLG